MKHLLLMAIIGVISVGCATKPTKFRYLSVGMSKAEVLDLLGDPYSVSATEGIEYLTYSYNRGPLSGEPALGGPQDYFVRFKNGRVDAYGRVGDFDSTQKPESTVNVNVTEKTNVGNRKSASQGK